ncbi:MAG: hypothetical protein J3R72DRAFT_167575 [Linnemannia gamsii]|nr:MAG: hypothetical protein J3R72DRAFT_167575 [Linnemannia gamsii]
MNCNCYSSSWFAWFASLVPAPIGIHCSKSNIHRHQNEPYRYYDIFFVAAGVSLATYPGFVCSQQNRKRSPFSSQEK